MGKNDPGEPSQFKLEAIPKLLDNPAWSDPRPNQALRDVILGLKKQGTRSSCCKSIKTFESHALIPSISPNPKPVSPQIAALSAERLISKVLNVKKLFLGAVETLKKNSKEKILLAVKRLRWPKACRFREWIDRLRTKRCTDWRLGMPI